MTKEFRISAKVAAALIAAARSEPNVECCGLLAGGADTVEILPARNSLNSPKAFEIAPNELFELFRAIRDRGLDLTAIYHSHPDGNNVPSKTDIALAYYPGIPYIILSPLQNAEQPIRAFLIEDGAAAEIKVIVT